MTRDMGEQMVQKIPKGPPPSLPAVIAAFKAITGISERLALHIAACPQVPAEACQLAIQHFGGFSAPDVNYLCAAGVALYQSGQ